MRLGKINYFYFLRTNKVNSRGLCPIYLKVGFESRFSEISSGIYINPIHWDRKKYHVSNDNFNHHVFEIWKQKAQKVLIDIYANDSEVDLNKIKTELSSKRAESHSPHITGFLQIFNSFIEKAKTSNQVEFKTIQKYTHIYNTVKDFFIRTYKVKDIAINDLKMKELLQYEEFCLHTLKHKQVTANKSLSILKQIMKYSIGHDFIQKSPWLLHKPKTVITEILYLSNDQLRLIENSDFNSDRLNKVKDCFIFQCFSGLGYHELAHASNANIVIKKNIKWLSLQRKKTKKNFLIPLLPPAAKIWEKYNGVLPVLSNQKLNAYLKEITQILKLDIELKTHLARKTYTSTVLLGNNVPLKIVTCLLGHSNSSVTEKHYASISNDLLESNVELLFKIFNDN
jgi:integrase/recombinase XerD